MRTFLTVLASFAVATPLFAGDGGATNRLGGNGPNFWDTPCGLPCFAIADAAGVSPNEMSAAERRSMQSVADMQQWLDARNARLATVPGSAAVGRSAPAPR